MGRKFHIGDVLSVATGRLVSVRHIDGVYDILGYMTGADLFTHQLPRAARSCAPELLRQHPGLSSVDATSVNGDNLREWLRSQAEIHGEELEVEPLADYRHMDPLDELAGMVGAKNGKQ